MLEWKDVLEMVVSRLGNDPESGACVLEFLTVLPEEIIEGRKITLTVRGAESPLVGQHSTTLGTQVRI